MIITLPDTTTAEVAKALVRARDEGGAVALGRVLTVLIVTPYRSEEQVIRAANDASREHPMRVIVLSHDDRDEDDEPGLDAEIRVGGDAGASEVVVLRARGETGRHVPGLVNGLLLPDAPLVTWWPEECPPYMGDTPLGQMAQRRISDSLSAENPVAHLATMASGYRPGDTDLAWARITGWRTQLASILDGYPEEVVSRVEVQGPANNPSTTLLAAWLGYCLGLPVSVVTDLPESHTGIQQVTMTTVHGDIQLSRSDENMAILRQPGQPDFTVFLPRRGLAQLLAEELRRLTPDPVFGAVLVHGLPRVHQVS